MIFRAARRDWVTSSSQATQFSSRSFAWPPVTSQVPEPFSRLFALLSLRKIAKPRCQQYQKYGSLRGGRDCLSGELGGIWFSGVAGRGLSVIFFLRCGAELSQAGPGVKPSRSPRSIICRIAVSRISTSVVYVDLRSPFGGWSYVRIVILWGPSAHVSGPVRLVWRRWPSSPIV
jgi:hypothetical protein